MIWRKKDKDNSAPDLPSLSRKEALILEMLVSGGRELFGLEMVEASGGELKRGTIYVTLQRMEAKGFVISKPEPRFAPEVGIPRRLYIATGLGQRVLAACQAAQKVMQIEPQYVGS